MSDMNNDKSGESTNSYVFDWKRPDMGSGSGTSGSSIRSSSARRDMDSQRTAVRKKQEEDILLFDTEETKTSNNRSSAKPSSLNKLSDFISAHSKSLTPSKTAPRSTTSPRNTTAARSTSSTRTSGTKKRRRKKSRKKLIIAWALRIGCVAAAILLIALLFLGLRAIVRKVSKGASETGNYPSYVNEQLLTVNGYSRPGFKTDGIKNVVIHSASESNKSAADIRKYYESLATSQESRVSCNFIVGMDGEVIVCVPDGEMSYAANDRNMDTVSVEYCYTEASGEIPDTGYESLVNITAWLCKKYKLKSSDVIRHYDITGRSCPKYYVNNQESWNQFQKDVAAAMKKL